MTTLVALLKHVTHKGLAMKHPEHHCTAVIIFETKNECYIDVFEISSNASKKSKRDAKLS